MFMYTSSWQTRVTWPERQRLGPQPPLELHCALSLLLIKMALPDIATRIKDMFIAIVFWSKITVSL